MAGTATPLEDDTAERAGRRTGLERDAIVAAALDLVEREGPTALTMRRLATELDVGTPTIYWHIPSRDELIAQVIRLQSNRLAAQPITGTTARDRVFSAARNIWTSSIDHHSTASLAHQTGTSSLLAHHLEAALVTELEAAGLRGQVAADASRAIIATITGALVLALRDLSRCPPDCRPDALWATSDAPIDPETRAALRREPDLETISATALRAVVEKFVPA